MRIIFTILLFLFTNISFGQQIPELIANVHVTGADKNIVAEVKSIRSAPTPDPSNNYYWYGAGIIHQTQGGYSGKLLNGTYNEYYLNKNLREQGSFNKGLKDGIWKTWNENGKLKQLFTYHNGIKNGLFNLYNENGVLEQTGYYRQGQLNGKIISYSKDVPIIVNYKDGKAVPERTAQKPSGFWSKLKFWGNLNSSQKKHPVQTNKGGIK